MAVALQATAIQSFTDPGSTSDTQAVTVDAGSDRCMVVLIQGEGNFGAISVSSVTYGGVALTRLDEASHASWSYSEVWYLVNPAVGTANVVVTLDASDFFCWGVLVGQGVDQITPLRTAVKATGSGTSSSLTVLSVGAGDLVFNSLAIDSAGHSAAPGADQTERWDRATGGNDGICSTQPGSAGGVMSYTWTTSADFSHVASAFIAASSGPTEDPATQGTATSVSFTPTGSVQAPGVQATALGSGTTPSAQIGATPTQGVGTGAGTTPSATAAVTATSGTGTGTGGSPSAAAGVSSGSATGTAGTPAPDIDAAATQGVATGVGSTPTTEEEFEPGVATGVTFTPTPAVAASAVAGEASAATGTPVAAVAVSPTLATALATSGGSSATITVSPSSGTATGVGFSPNDGLGEDAYPTTGETLLVIYQAPNVGLTINQHTAELTINQAPAGELTIDNSDGELTINAS